MNGMDDYISRQAAIDGIDAHYIERITLNDWQAGWNDALEWAKDVYLDELPSVRPEPKWIPVKFRPMDSEEREYWEEQFGGELADEDAVMFDCPMPEDGQEILVSYRKWIGMDKCEIDCGCYGLEGNGDWDGVIAWMPLPKPYEGSKR